jgi:hypothetical protein
MGSCKLCFFVLSLSLGEGRGGDKRGRGRGMRGVRVEKGGQD